MGILSLLLIPVDPSVLFPVVRRSPQEEEAIIVVRNRNAKKGVDAETSAPIVRRPPDAMNGGKLINRALIFPCESVSFPTPRKRVCSLQVVVFT